MIADFHTSNGVQLHMKKGVKEFKSTDGAVSSVVLSDGTEIKADMVLVSAGITPATKFVENSNISLDKVGGVVCDPFLQTSAKDVYAAGDIAYFPYWPIGERIRVEHWNHA